MNKLYEEKRFDDIIKVYNQANTYFPQASMFSLNIAELFFDALVEQVSQNIFNKLQNK
jgi:hypothetical protein